MPAFVTKYLVIGIVALLSIGAAYLLGRSHVNELREADKAIAKSLYDAQVAETKRIQDKWNEAKETESEIKVRLDAATARGTDLAKRLREYANRSVSAVSSPTGPASESDSPGGVRSNPSGFGDRIGVALENHLGACARDSERLNSWITFYRQLQDAQR